MANKKSVDQHARLPASIIASNLTLRQLKVYAALSFFKGGNATCWPKIATLCRMTHIDDRNLTRVLKELEEIGFIKRELRNVEGRSTMYTLYEPDVDVFVDDEDLDLPANLATTIPAKLATTPPGQFSRDIEQDIINSTEEQESQLCVIEKDQVEKHFYSFWANYPRKIGKGQALKAFRAALKRENIKEIAAGFGAFLESCKGKDPQYIPHAATWLNGDRWTDDYKQERRAPTNFGID